MFVRNDYRNLLSDADYNLLFGSGVTRTDIEAAAIAEARGYLSSRYDTALAFPSIPAYTEDIIYLRGDVVTHEGVVNVVDAGETDTRPLAPDWKKGDVSALTSVIYEDGAVYAPGTVICRRLDHCNEYYRTDGSSDLSRFTRLVVRDKAIVMFTLDIVLYHAFSSINPQHIPELRIERYERAISWLRHVQDGKVTAAVPFRTDTDTGRAFSSSRIRSNNKSNPYW